MGGWCPNVTHLHVPAYEGLTIPEDCAFNGKYLAEAVYDTEVEYSADLERIRNKTGTNFSWIDFADELAARHAIGAELPPDIDDDDALLINEISDKEWDLTFETYQNETARHMYINISVGPFATELIQLLTAVKAGNDAGKLHLFAGHDQTLACLAAILVSEDEYPIGQPRFASFFSLEVDDTL